MEAVEDIVIAGGGMAGLATALGIRSLVLESSHLRTSGYALGAFSNGCKALDALGVGQLLRQHHVSLQWNMTTSAISGVQTSEMPLNAKGKHGDHEVRCLSRKFLLESLLKELPTGTVRFSSKVVCIEESGFLNLVHLADGTILKAKVLVGRDGVANWLGFKKPAFTKRNAIRGWVNFKRDHEFEPKFLQFFGKGVRSGAAPPDGHTIYWFVTWTPASIGGIGGLGKIRRRELSLLQKGHISRVGRL